MSIGKAQGDVREFHIKFGVLAPNEPVDAHEVNWTAHVQRGMWVDSEVLELVDAVEKTDVAALADAYIDIAYFALGGLVELGIDGSPLWDAVHRANMAKVKLPGVAKIAKPEGWTAPDIRSLIEAQRKAAKPR